MLNILSKFSNENIEVVAPLTYGDEKYIHSVIQHGSDLLGNKFMPLTQLMTPVEYNKYLSTIDVVILNHRRQQGFGNIVIALYFGAKIFIRREVSTWDYLSNAMNCFIHDTGELANLDFVEVVRNNSKVIDENRAAVAHLFDRKWQKKKWERMYVE